MDNYRELAERLRTAMGEKPMAVVQGIVESVEGRMCCVRIGNLVVQDVRLRPSETDDDGELLITPKVGTAVTMGCLNGDLANMVVLAVDHAETISINGGKLGGLINIETLTQKLNDLVNAFNSHTHTGVHGATSAPLTQAQSFSQGDYEDKKIKH